MIEKECFGGISQEVLLGIKYISRVDGALMEAISSLSSGLSGTISDKKASISIQKHISSNEVVGNHSPGTKLIVVCGSAFLMCEARSAIGIEEPQDDPI